jgi:hypothetical protein
MVHTMVMLSIADIDRGLNGVNQSDHSTHIGAFA